MKTSNFLESLDCTLLSRPLVSNRENYLDCLLQLAVDVCRQAADMEGIIMLKYMKALDEVMTTGFESSVDSQIHPPSQGAEFTQNNIRLIHWSAKMAPSCASTTIILGYNQESPLVDEQIRPQPICIYDRDQFEAQASIRTF